MIHKYISSRVVVERIFDNYGIQSEDFVTRVATWTYNVLRDIGIRQSYVLKNISINFNNHRICIPQYVDRIYGVKINGMTATLDFQNNTLNKSTVGGGSVVGFSGEIFKDETNIINLVTTSNNLEALTEDGFTAYIIDGNQVLVNSTFNPNYWDKLDMSEIKYNILNGWIQTNIEQGNCEILCGVLPYELDSVLDIIFPIIPDEESLINSITQYCLQNILMRGYKHSVLSLTANNEFTNPALAYKNSKMLVRNNCNSLSPSAKDSLSKLIGLTII